VAAYAGRRVWVPWTLKALGLVARAYLVLTE
jgi:hypothetical protein